MKGRGIMLNSETCELEIRSVFGSDSKIAYGLSIGDTKNQNIGIIVQSNPGELKEYPLLGVGIDGLQLGHDSLLYKHKIRRQLELDDLKVTKLEINKKTIEIDAKYS